jgi:uncharacterized protein (DUF2461 family)
VDYCFDEFKKIIQSRKFKSVYETLYSGEGVSLSKVPHGFEKDNPAAKWLRLKSFLAMKSLGDRDITSKNLLRISLDALAALQPLLGFMNRALEG